MLAKNELPTSLGRLRQQRDEITRVATRHGARTLRVFGSVARGDEGPGSDVDVLVELDERRGLFDQAALQRGLGNLLGCPVHVMTVSGLSQADAKARERIEREAGIALSPRTDVERLADMRAALADIR
jgi:predicted nucleotidyltransferase